MTEMAMKPKNNFSKKVLRKIILEKEEKNTKKTKIVGQNHCKADGPKIPENIKIIIINYGRICFLKLDNAISLQPFFRFLAQNHFCHENYQQP